MVFVTAKSKQENKFSLDGFKSKKSVKSHAGLGLWQKLSIAIFIGALLALSSPGFDQWWLAWFMVAPFLVLLTFCHKNSESLLTGLCFGLGYHLISLHYYLDTAISSNGSSATNWQTAFLIWILQATMLSLPTMVFAWLITFLPLRPGYIPYFRRPFFPYLLSVPLLWVFLHWGLAIAHPFTQIWQSIQLPFIFIDPLAYSQYCLLDILQLVRFVGPAGLEFLLLLVNTTIAAFIVQIVRTQDGPVERVDLISPRAGALLDVLIALALVGASYAFGQMQVAHSLADANDLKLSTDPKNELAQPIESIGLACGDWFLPRTSSLTQPQLAITIFPEASKEISFDQASRALNELKMETRQNDSSVFLNFVSKEGHNLIRHNLIFAPTKSLSIKQQIFDSDDMWSAIANSREHSVGGVNRLSALCSLSTPLKKWIFALDKNNPSSWYSLAVPKIREGKVGLLSGSDITDYRLAAHEVRRGASLLVSSIDLSWSGNEYLNKQLLAAAIYRAIENNRYVIISTSGGLSAIIEPNGAVQSLSFAQLNPAQGLPSQNPIVLGTVQFRWSKTPFTKMWWL